MKNTKYLKKGNTWIPTLTVTDDDEPFNCTGYTAKLWIKTTLKETAPEIRVLDITWTDQAGGVGFFNLMHEMSINLLGRYWYEIILYEEISNDVVRTLIQDRLIVRETLEIIHCLYGYLYDDSLVPMVDDDLLSLIIIL